MMRSGRELISSDPIPSRKRSSNTRVLRSGGESISSGPIPKRKRSSTTPILRSVRVLSSLLSSSTIASKSKYGSTVVSDPGDDVSDRSYQKALLSIGPKWEDPPDDRPLKYAHLALDYYNQHSSRKFKLLKLTAATPVLLRQGAIFHINFTAIDTDVAHAPEEMFFTELTNMRVFSIRLCVSLGPVNSLSGGDRLNGCYYCRQYNNVQHPKGGGFVRGGDGFYIPVQDICDINQNNAIPDHEKHLSIRFKQVSRSHEPRKEREYISEQVDDESLYATEALKFYNEHFNYELVRPGSVTRVILPTCLLFHVSFKAKETDVATAPEEMFFAEMTSTSGVISCTGCMILTPTELISGDKTNGCYYCHEFNNVHHPDGGFVRGGDSLYMLEKELE